MAIARPPSSAIISTVSRAVASLRSTTATDAPSCANSRAVALPMPAPAPVISATLPASRIALLLLLCDELGIKVLLAGEHFRVAGLVAQVGREGLSQARFRLLRARQQARRLHRQQRRATTARLRLRRQRHGLAEGIGEHLRPGGRVAERAPGGDDLTRLRE